MKTVYRYIKFVKRDNGTYGCLNKKGGYALGFVEWHPRWKCWQFCPECEMAFTIDCLADIIHFIKQLESQ